MADWLITSLSTYRRFEENLHRNAPRDKGLEIRASDLTGIPVKWLRRTYDKSYHLKVPFPHTENTAIAEERRKDRRNWQRLKSDFWSGDRNTIVNETTPPDWQDWLKIELDRVEWAAILEDVRQQRRRRHKKSMISPRNFEAEVKDAIEKRFDDPLTVLEYNRLDRFWSQQKVATEIGISQSQYSKIEQRKCNPKSKKTSANLDKLERLFGISKKDLFLPWYKIERMQETNVYRLVTGGKNKPEGRRRLSFKEFEERHEEGRRRKGPSLVDELDRPKPKIPWYTLRWLLQYYQLSPFRVLRMYADRGKKLAYPREDGLYYSREDVDELMDELLFRDR
jgi:transcriptional regulator with XRE-family HTH domain